LYRQALGTCKQIGIKLWSNTNPQKLY
jgi:hypothetical protein